MTATFAQTFAAALARIGDRFDPNAEINAARARIERRRERSRRREFITGCLAHEDGYWTAIHWLSKGFGFQFLSMKEAVRVIRGHMRRYRMNMAAGRTHYVGVIAYSDLRHRLVVASYFNRFGRELLEREAQEAA
jgi:hypothetical protein